MIHPSTLLTILLLLTSQLQAQEFSSSNLPIIILETEEDYIPDEPKMDAYMGIIFNEDGSENFVDDPFNHFEGNIGIETRGNSTQGFDKQTYSVELRTEDNEDFSTSLLGMGVEEDWILHAMVIDKTQLRIPLSWDLFRGMGHYSSHWRFVELVWNGEYRGLYLLCERIKRDNDRVDIARLDEDDLQGDSLTGGYILRIDWLDDFEGFESEFESQGGIPQHYHWYYPRAENIQEEQEEYIEEYMYMFESAVFSDDYHNEDDIRYTDYIDVTSFVDFLLINEFTKNSDGYKLSTYMHKDRNGPLTAGPIWDFDQTYGLSVVCSSHETDGWMYLQEQDGCEDIETMPMWWRAMMEDPVFTNHLKCRWEKFKDGLLSQDSIFEWIDQYVEFLEEPLERNFEQWEFIGEYIWIEPDDIPDSYEGEIEYLKDWIHERIAWLDDNMPGNCDEDIISGTSDHLKSFQVSFLPNPFHENVEIKTKGNTKVNVLNSNGQLITSFDLLAQQQLILDTNQWAKGVYFFNAYNGQSSTSLRLVKL